MRFDSLADDPPKREWVFLVGKKRGGGGGRKKVKSGERKLESERVFYFYFN